MGGNAIGRLGGVLGLLVAGAIYTFLLSWFRPGEIRCGINWMGGCNITVVLTVAAAVVGGLLRIARPLRRVFGRWFFLCLFGGALAIIVWVVFLAPPCPFPSR
jgi:hypothetical protein